MSKGGYGFGAKNNRKADDMCYRKKFPFSFGKCLGVQLDVCGMFKNGDDCYTGTYTADDTVINAWEKNTVIRWFCFLSYRKALRAGGAGPALHPAPAYSSKQKRNAAVKFSSLSARGRLPAVIGTV